MFNGPISTYPQFNRVLVRSSHRVNDSAVELGLEKALAHSEGCAWYPGRKLSMMVSEQNDGERTGGSSLLTNASFPATIISRVLSEARWPRNSNQGTPKCSAHRYRQYPHTRPSRKFTDLIAQPRRWTTQRRGWIPSKTDRLSRCRSLSAKKRPELKRRRLLSPSGVAGGGISPGRAVRPTRRQDPLR